jgi:hypothetical protein
MWGQQLALASLVRQPQAAYYAAPLPRKHMQLAIAFAGEACDLSLVTTKGVV